MKKVFTIDLHNQELMNPLKGIINKVHMLNNFEIVELRREDVIERVHFEFLLITFIEEGTAICIL